MSRRSALAITSCAFVVLGLACVDLFHSTDFETLCTRSPNDPECGGSGDAAPDGNSDGGSDADAARPHPDFCAWSSSEARVQAVRACAWLGACEGPLGESAFGPCVVRAQLAFDCGATPSLRPRGAVDAFWGCLATVKSCGDVDGCVFPAGVQDCVAVPVGSSSACGTLAANAAVRLKCAGPAGRAAGVEPCVMLGQTCSPEDPSTSRCSGTRGFACIVNECAGASLIDCTSAGVRLLDRGIDCAGYGGGGCLAGDAGLFCTPGDRATTACPVQAAPACDGPGVTSCVGGKEIRVACDRLGLPCDVSQAVAPYDPTAACVDRDAGACSPAAPDTCIGDTLESCGRGALYQVSCGTVGLDKCKIDGSGRGSCTRR